jgi:hypothetical protein
LWLEGVTSYRENPTTGHLPYLVGVNGDAFSFPREDIPKYMTPYFYSWLEIWWFFHEKGMLPYNKSWYMHPARIIKIIRIFENCYNKFNNDKAEKTSRKLDEKVGKMRSK